jgi:hypothetical protein
MKLRFLIYIPLLALLCLGCGHDSPASILFNSEAGLYVYEVEETQKTIRFLWEEGHKGGIFSYRLYESSQPLGNLSDFSSATPLTGGWIGGNNALVSYNPSDPIHASNPAVGTHYYGLLAQAPNGSQFLYPGTIILNDTYVPDYQVWTFDKSLRNIYYNMTLGSGKKIYYLYTNPQTGARSLPERYASYYSLSGPGAEYSRGFAGTPSRDRTAAAPEGFGRRDKPEILNWQGADLISGGTSPWALRSITSPQKNILPDATTVTNKRFYLGLTAATSDSVLADCRKSYGLDAAGNSDNAHPAVVLNIYTANNDGYTNSTTITNAMIDALAEKFLKAGLNNDIYDWVTGIFGEPWGEHGYTNLIPNDNDTIAITILILDIDKDHANQFSQTGGFTAGYYYAKDNYKTSAYGGSNQRLMFYLDAPALAKADGTWDITDPYPADQVSTLAHEFQHMIHFYQKAVLEDTASETWLNEMCSMIAEDLVADKIPIPGPRGLDLVSGAYDHPGTAGTLIASSRISQFNYYSEYSITNWRANGSTYGPAYAFGAYLARNYGGAPLFQKIVQSPYGGMDAVIHAIGELPYPEPDTGDLLSRWGTAVLLSDKDADTFSSPAYDYYDLKRTGGSPAGSFSSTLDGRSYFLGSIDHWNFPYYGAYLGPFCYTSTTAPSTLEPVSNLYYYRGTTSAVTSLSEHIHLSPGMRLTIVIRD